MRNAKSATKTFFTEKKYYKIGKLTVGHDSVFKSAKFCFCFVHAHIFVA